LYKLLYALAPYFTIPFSANGDDTANADYRLAMSMTTNKQESIDLLLATHSFPGPFTFKVIGRTEGDFTATVIAVFQELIVECEEIPHRVRETSGGRHVAVTVEPTVDSPELVLVIYERLKEIPGVVMLL
jgi:putative lipoic acid-binding regulatory protein